MADKPGGAGADDGNKKVHANSVEEMKEDLEGRYTVAHMIGSGAYGTVWRATSAVTGNNMALKRIRNRKDTGYCLKRTLREIKILRHFKHDNIVSLHDLVMSRNETCLYLVLDLMESDLHKIIQSPQQLSADHIKWFLYQLLRALKYLHSANVVHRDIKPSNLLVNSNCMLKLADFGMARCLNDPSILPTPQSGASETTPNGAAVNVMTIYVATRWYRSPELILCHSEYTTSIDMWSVGCILAELLNRKPLFPGKSQLHQLELIISHLGNPKQSFINHIKSERIKAYVIGLPRSSKHPQLLEKFANCQSREAMDLLQRLLLFEPNHRLAAEFALAHSFFKPHHNPTEEPICCSDFDYSFENSLATSEQLCAAIGKEIEKIAEKRKRRKLFDIKKVESISDNPLAEYYQKLIQQKYPQNGVETRNLKPSTSQRSEEVTSHESSIVTLVRQKDAVEIDRKEQSQAVKAQLRAAILSNNWHTKTKRKSRAGRPRNSSRVAKKQKPTISNVRSLPQPIPVISKEDLGLLAQIKQPTAPITIKLITKPANAAEGTKNSVVTLSFCPPKAKVLPKTAAIPVPKFVSNVNQTVPTRNLRPNRNHSMVPVRDISSTAAQASSNATVTTTAFYAHNKELRPRSVMVRPATQIIYSANHIKNIPTVTHKPQSPQPIPLPLVTSSHSQWPSTSKATSKAYLNPVVIGSTCSTYEIAHGVNVSVESQPVSVNGTHALDPVFTQVLQQESVHMGSGASSAATVPFQDEMDELTYKLSSSSINNGAHPFNESLAPSYYIAGTERQHALVAELPVNDLEASLGEPAGLVEDATAGYLLDLLPPLEEDDCLSGFNFNSALMREIENGEICSPNLDLFDLGPLS